MKTFEVTEGVYNWARQAYRGYIFSRASEGKFYLRPAFKFVTTLLSRVAAPLLIALFLISCTPMNDIAKSDKARHAVRQPGKSR